MDALGSGGMIGKIMAFARGFGATLVNYSYRTIVMSAFDLITGLLMGSKSQRVIILYLNLLMV